MAQNRFNGSDKDALLEVVRMTGVISEKLANSMNADALAAVLNRIQSEKEVEEQAGKDKTGGEQDEAQNSSANSSSSEELAVKPKRKYTRRKKIDENSKLSDSTVIDNSLVDTMESTMDGSMDKSKESESLTEVKPKRKYTRRKKLVSEESSVSDTKEASKLVSEETSVVDTDKSDKTEDNAKLEASPKPKRKYTRRKKVTEENKIKEESSEENNQDFDTDKKSKLAVVAEPKSELDQSELDKKDESDFDVVTENESEKKSKTATDEDISEIKPKRKYKRRKTKQVVEMDKADSTSIDELNEEVELAETTIEKNITDEESSSEKNTERTKASKAKKQQAEHKRDSGESSENEEDAVADSDKEVNNDSEKTVNHDSDKAVNHTDKKENDRSKNSRKHKNKNGGDNRQLSSGEEVEGVLEIMPDGYGFLRRENYLQSSKDIYIPPQFIRRFNLRAGDYISGPGRVQRDSDRFQALYFIKEINGQSPENMYKRQRFDRLTPIYPEEMFKLETTRNELSTRIIDLVCPIGKGQRGMIVSPPKAGKTILLKKIANAISENNPDCKLIVLLIDERPEEVTDMQRSINGEVVYSTFDKTPENHVKITELVLERAMRLVEMGEDVVVLLDSITRMSRAYNLTINPTGRTLSGGLDPGALYGPKRFFGAARNIEHGGSLTIIATALVETGSRMDELIFEEFKGTGNMEVYLDRKLSEKRIFPAIDINRSSTRREELLLEKKALDAVWTIRKAFGQLESAAVTETVMNLLLKTQDNDHFISSINLSMQNKGLMDSMRLNSK